MLSVITLAFIEARDGERKISWLVDSASRCIVYQTSTAKRHFHICSNPFLKLFPHFGLP